jgi:hypothetical protein
MNEYPFRIEKISLNGSQGSSLTFLESFHLNFDDDVQRRLEFYFCSKFQDRIVSQFVENDRRLLAVVLGMSLMYRYRENFFRILAFFKNHFLFYSE